MRAYVAIPLPDALCAALKDLQRTLPVGRPVPPDDFHVTLVFLPDLPEAELGDVHETLCEIRCAPFPLTLRGCDLFGGATPRVVAMSVEPSEPLGNLQRAVLAALRNAGQTPQRQKFRPHVTLARIGPRLDAGTLGALQGFVASHLHTALDTVTVHGFKMMKSTLKPEGARHDCLAEYHFSGNGVWPGV